MVMVMAMVMQPCSLPGHAIAMPCRPPARPPAMFQLPGPSNINKWINK